MIDLFTIVCALLPIAAYLLVIGSFQLRRRSTVISGFMDTLLLGFAVGGLAMIGPLDLFVPETAAYRFGSLLRVLLLVLYVLILLLVAMARRPRMVVLNASESHVMETLGELTRGMDDQTVWAGYAAHLPQRKLDLHVEFEPASNTVQVRSLSREIDFGQWTRLRRTFQSQLGRQQVATNTRAVWSIASGAMLFLAVGWVCTNRWPAVARGFAEWLNR